MKKDKLRILIILSFSGFVTVMLWFCMFFGFRKYWRDYLLWNLFLAWIPLFFAVFSKYFYYKSGYYRIFTIIFSFLWLLFFPNSPYIITDLRYIIEYRPDMFYWYDLIMQVAFAINGLLIGFVSLKIMQNLVERMLGRMASWVFALISLILCGYGVIIGRFLRWNSWEIFTIPQLLVADIFNSLSDPFLLFLASIFSIFLITTYFVVTIFSELN